MRGRCCSIQCVVGQPLFSGRGVRSALYTAATMVGGADAASDTIFLAFGGDVLLEVGARTLLPTSASASAAVDLAQGLAVGVVPLARVAALAFTTEGCVLVAG